MIHLQAIYYRGSKAAEYPFSLPLLRNFTELVFDTPLTFFVGENGSGKSTLLEGIAALVKLPAIGGQPLQQDDSLKYAHRFAKQLKPVWQKTVRRGFFLRAEDFFGFVRGMEHLRRELRQDLEEAERLARERGASEYAVSMSRMPWQGQMAALQQRYGTDLDAASHGESFLQLLQARIVPQGLYLLDEPEAALSPMRILALMAFFKEAIETMDCQFIIASHSPILLAYPQARIIYFNNEGLQPVEYSELEHVRFTKEFLQDPRRFLRHL